jgi:competence protein ComFC
MPVFTNKTIFTFEGVGPAWSLIKAFKSGKNPKLAEGLARFMAFQYLQSDLPVPDLITHVPQSLYRFIQIGYNPSFLLANHISKVLKTPLVSLLKRKRQLVQQMRVDQQKRYFLSSKEFLWKSKTSINKKTILLIDDIVGTGATLRCCEKRLSEKFPLKIFSMVFAKQYLC